MLCEVCDKNFHNKSNLNRHLKVIHGVQYVHKNSVKHKDLKCHICQKTFFDKSALNKHTSMVHNIKNNLSVPEQASNIRCVECKINFNKKKCLIKHLVITHNFKEEYVCEEFVSLKDFYEWLKCEERENKVEYSRTTGKSEKKQICTYYYECNRSGSLPVEVVNRKRTLKSQGSQKIGFMCTSHIIINVNNSTNAVSMKYFKTHYGHDIELQHIRIPKNTRYEIASKLALGVTTNNIIRPIRSSFISNDLDRTDLITKKDIYNINKKSFNVDVSDGIRHSDDATSVSLWVKECLGEHNNPVLFYKPQGYEDNQYNLNISDFCIIIMNNLQQEAIKTFSNKFVCIDGTHGTNPYDFELTSLMVSDDFGEGIAVAYLVSNRTDTAIYELFFKNIKNAVGIITTDTFMSDITETFYNGWSSVMGPVPNRLFCSWHVDRAWKKNLTKICPIEKRKDIYKSLKFLQTTLEIDSFERYFCEFLIQLNDDPDTKIFYEYFTKNYVANKKSWAYCFRKQLLINTNMYLESMHRILKYEYLEGRKVKRLDKMVHKLMCYTRDKQIERLIKLTKGKKTHRLKSITDSHKIAVSSNFVIEIPENNTKDEFRTWLVTNTVNQKTYTVIEKTNTMCCPLSCQICKICYHSYTCTCLDYFIKSNICKHIHYIYINVTNPSQTCSVENHSMEDIQLSLKYLRPDQTPRDNFKLQQILKNAALEIITLADNCSDEHILKVAIKQIKTTTALLANSKDVERKEFEIGADVKLEPSNKKIQKQLPLFSTKKKKVKCNDSFKKPIATESDSLEEVFSKVSLSVSKSAKNDHNYTSSVE